MKGIETDVARFEDVMSRQGEPGRMASAGSPAATASGRFEDVVLPHADLAFQLARRLTRDENEAEDLVQETFLRAFRAFDRFELREYGAKPWLFKILHHVFCTRWSRAVREPTLLQDVDFDDFAAELEREPLPQLAAGQIDWEGFDEELKAAVDKLSPEYRSVLLLWSLGDLSYKEIASVLGCAIGTVMSRLYRARQTLGASLADYAKRHGFTAAADG